jgi:flagellin-like protein
MVMKSILGKRGVSEVVTTILFILLALVAIGIVWAFFSGLLQTGTEEASGKLDCLSAQLSVRSAALEDVVDNDNIPEYVIVVERASGSSDAAVVDEVALILDDGSNRAVYRTDVDSNNNQLALMPLESARFVLATGLFSVDSSSQDLKASVAAVIGENICPESLSRQL